MAADTQTAPSASDANRLQRPPARPQARNSRHALEPNPFEQSFSSKPSDSGSQGQPSPLSDHRDDVAAEGKPSNAQASTNDKVAATDKKPEVSKSQSGAVDPSSSSSSSSPTKELPETGNRAGSQGAASTDSKPMALSEKDKDRTAGAAAASPSSTSSPASKSKAAAATASAASTTTTTGNNGKGAAEATSTPNNKRLPGVASITSPTSEGGNQYPWTGQIGSLRAGPLSPAMLTGPQTNHPFDPASFRTGFTPDLSNFKTGLTPLGSASGYPPPSPGTAAFMAMVNNNASTITPNTLSALTGHASSYMGDVPFHDTRPSVHHDQNNTSNSGNASSSSNKENHQTSAGSDSHSQNVSPEMVQQPLPNQGQYQDQGRGKNGRQSQGPQAANNQQQTTQAASGLFMLSRAHQELAKRDHQGDAGGYGQQQQQHNHQHHQPAPYPNGMVQGQPPMPYGHMPPHGQHMPPHYQQQQHGAANNSNAGKGGSSKRKKGSENGSQAGTNTTAGGKPSKKAKGSVKEEESGDEDGDQQSDIDGSQDAGGDDEDKRKNFLERNRQAALKCRQRKKAWLQDLQAKVAFFEAENGNLQGTLGALRNEVMFLKSQLMQAQQMLSSKGMSMPGPQASMAAPMDVGMGGMMPHGMHMQGMGSHHPQQMHPQHLPPHVQQQQQGQQGPPQGDVNRGRPSPAPGANAARKAQQAA